MKNINEFILGTKGTQSDFPLRASLFYKRQNGQFGSTWDYLARDTTTEVQEKVNKQIEYNSNAMTFLIYNMVDPKVHPVNPFIGNPTAAQVVAGGQTADVPECERWKGLIQAGADPNVYLIPCLFCGDDGATTNNTAFHDMFIPPVIQFFNPYSKAYIISTEASKTMSVRQMERMISVCKNSMLFNQKPVGVHLQWDRRSNLPGNLDFLVYEFSWDPHNGDQYSVSAVIMEALDVVAHLPSGFPVWFQEMNIHPEGQLAREQTRALRDRIPGIIGLPGPV